MNVEHFLLPVVSAVVSNWSQKEHLCTRLNDDEKKHHINSRLRQRCGLICTLYLDSLRC